MDDAERLRRMTLSELLNGLAIAGPIAPDRPRVDLSGRTDRELLQMIPDDCFVDSAIEELVKRANSRRLTMADYIKSSVRNNRNR